MRHWLARLGFALLVLAFVFAWEGYRAAAGERGPEAKGKATWYYVGAALTGGLGLAGIRERHRTR
jgi:hypothetical protein